MPVNVGLLAPTDLHVLCCSLPSHPHQIVFFKTISSPEGKPDPIHLTSLKRLRTNTANHITSALTTQPTQAALQHPNSANMSKTNPIIIASSIAAAVIGAGYFVARQGATHPIGDKIPGERARLQTELAQHETLKSGKGDAAAATADTKQKGGDQGLMNSEESKIVDVKPGRSGERGVAGK